MGVAACVGAGAGACVGSWCAGVRVCLLFVLESIRSAMRVIHITVNTEETQRLRIKFVLYCST